MSGDKDFFIYSSTINLSFLSYHSNIKVVEAEKDWILEGLKSAFTGNIVSRFFFFFLFFSCFT